MTTKGFMKKQGDEWLVGASDKTSNYDGPVARISYDKTWLNIVTDDYEGHAMLNIETLPCLRRALAQLAKKRKKAPPNP